MELQIHFLSKIGKYLMAKAAPLERTLRFLRDAAVVLRFAFFVKYIPKSNVVDERLQISHELCQLISQTTQEKKWVDF